MNYDARISSKIADVDGWISRSDLQLIAAEAGTPVFVYSEEQLQRNIDRIQGAAVAAGIDKRVELYVPFFPNSNPHILKPLQTADIGILLQLPSEYEILRKFGFDKFIISPGHVSNDEISAWAKTGHPMFLSSMDEISHLLAVDSSASINMRFDSLGSGKPGIKYSELTTLSELLARHGRDLDCFELYCGSGNSADAMISIIEQVFMIFKTYFPKAKAINFAGGFGFDYEGWAYSEKHFNWEKYFKRLGEIADRYGVPADVKFLFEPARDLLADVGALLLSIERTVIKHPGANRVLTNGSRVLMPSAQYKERRHNVLFLDSNMAEITSNRIPAAVRGRGILRHDYVLPGDYMVPETLAEDDYLVILDVGAYCATQHMEFLNIPPAAEVLIDKSGSPALITAQGNKFDKWRNLLDQKKELRPS